MRDRQPRCEFAVPRGTQRSLLQDEQCPFVAEHTEHPADGIGAARG
jgi:hypothetical protein